MKTFLLLSSVLLAVGAEAKPVDEQRALAAETARRKAANLPLTEPAKSNQTVGERFTVSGIAVQAVKAENPLQLLNPVAPVEYGYAKDNVTRDPRTGIVDGLKILSFKF
jgi:hypothetical protein